MIIGYAADTFIRIRFQVAVAVVRIAGAGSGFEALGFAAGVGYGSEAVGTGGVGIGEVVDLAEGTRALDEALALQRADVAAQVVGKGFVEAVGGGSRAAGIDIEIGRRFQAAEGVVGEGVGCRSRPRTRQAICAMLPPFCSVPLRPLIVPPVGEEVVKS